MIFVTQPLPIKKSFSSEQFFSLQYIHKPTQTIILMKLFTKDIHTGLMPNTLSVLKKELPTILRSHCFNEDNQPFRIEVKQTEIGHLFEHILLEYLCKQKLQNGSKTATFSGTTDWNWNKDPQGTFWITIRHCAGDIAFFDSAIQNAKKLTNRIFKHHNITQSTFVTPYAFPLSYA